MILCKYSKEESAAFIPHLDILRAVGMAIRRCGLQIDYSEGFNPHMQLFFNQPLPIGTESGCEYFCAHSKENAEIFKNKLNEKLPNGIKIISTTSLNENPNVAALIAMADYRVEFSSLLNEQKINELFSSPVFIINYKSKDEEVTKDVKTNIYSFEAKENVLKLRLSCGNVNLRADRVADSVNAALNEKYAFKVKKTTALNALGKNIDELF